MKSSGLMLAGTLLLSLQGAPAIAFDLPPPDPLIEFSIASRGYSKGVAQTDDLQLVVRPEVAFGSLRIGAYAKNVASPAFDGEFGASVGYRKAFGKTELSGSAAIKHLFDPVGNVDKAALELAFAATRAVGKLKPRVSVTYSPDDLGPTGKSLYWEGGAAYQFIKQTSASAGIAIRSRDGGPDYTSFNAGLAHRLGPFTADVRYYDTNKNNLGTYFHRRVVVNLRARF